MGLDHWLQAERYHDGGWSWVRDEHPERGEQFDRILEACGLQRGDVSESGLTVKLRVITWRKVNAIHGWVIDHCWSEEKDDNCVNIPLSREDVEALRDDCAVALALYQQGELDRAAQTMTPTPGFFFGSTKIDEWWAKDMEEAKTELTKVLDNPRFAGDDWSFSYYAWY